MDAAATRPTNSLLVMLMNDDDDTECSQYLRFRRGLIRWTWASISATKIHIHMYN